MRYRYGGWDTGTEAGSDGEIEVRRPRYRYGGCSWG